MEVRLKLSLLPDGRPFLELSISKLSCPVSLQHESLPSRTSRSAFSLWSDNTSGAFMLFDGQRDLSIFRLAPLHVDLSLRPSQYMEPLLTHSIRAAPVGFVWTARRP